MQPGKPWGASSLCGRFVAECIDRGDPLQTLTMGLTQLPKLRHHHGDFNIVDFATIIPYSLWNSSLTLTISQLTVLTKAGSSALPTLK
jgi:hypothetical protein